LLSALSIVVCGWKITICRLQSTNRIQSRKLVELPQKQCGRPLLLGEELKEKSSYHHEPLGIGLKNPNRTLTKKPP